MIIIYESFRTFVGIRPLFDSRENSYLIKMASTIDESLKHFAKVDEITSVKTKGFTEG